MQVQQASATSFAATIARKAAHDAKLAADAKAKAAKKPRPAAVFISMQPLTA